MAVQTRFNRSHRLLEVIAKVALQNQSLPLRCFCLQEVGEEIVTEMDRMIVSYEDNSSPDDAFYVRADVEEVFRETKYKGLVTQEVMAFYFLLTNNQCNLRDAFDFLRIKCTLEL